MQVIESSNNDFEAYISPPFPMSNPVFANRSVLMMNVVSDLFITLAYVSIPLMLTYFVFKRPDFPFRRMFLLFGGFIVSCGGTHFVGIFMPWYHVSSLHGVVKLFTALISCFTSLALYILLPHALKIPSPAQLEAINHELFINLTERREAERLLQEQNRRLEVLRNVTHEVRKSLRLDDISKAASCLIGAHFSADCCAIYILKKEVGNDKMSETPYLELAYEYLSFGMSECFPKVMHTTDPFVYETIEQGIIVAHNGTHLLGKNLEYPLHHIIMSRTSFQTNPNGLLVLAHRDRAKTFSTEERSLLEALSEQIGTALTQSQLLEIQKIQNQTLVSKNHDLEKARQAAEIANSSKSEFLAMMSHEVRTPLNSIIGLTGLLMEGDLDEVQKDYVCTVQQSGEALLAIIKDILDYAKIDLGKVVLTMKPFMIRDCIEETMDFLSSTAAKKGLQLSYIMEKNVPNSIIGDSPRLRQILLNLVGNSTKFTEKGSVTIRVTARTFSPSSFRSKAPPNQQQYEIRFQVQDTGIGIPPEAMELLFKPFSQVNSSTTRLYGGTGLGLAISKRLIEEMGGTVTVQSKVGVGSIFSFTIKANVENNSNNNNNSANVNSTNTNPAEPPAPPPLTITSPKDSYLTIPQKLTQGKRVLVVEPVEVISEFLHLELTASKFVVDIQKSPIKALEMLKLTFPVDFELPESLIEDSQIPSPIPSPSLSSNQSPLLPVTTNSFNNYIVKNNFSNSPLVPVHKKYDLIIIDVSHEKGTVCLDLARTIKAVSNIPVIIISFFGRQDSFRDESMRNNASPGKEKCAFPIVSKPIKLTHLNRAVVTSLDHEGKYIVSAPSRDSRENLFVRGIQDINILVVDDNDINLKVCVKQLQQLGCHHIFTACNGVETIAALKKEHNVDLILMDVMMPFMDGYQTTKEVRKMIHHGPERPWIIALTANAFPEDQQKCFEVGMNACLLKPVRLRELSAEIKTYLQKNIL
eukprot:TRINITY_DN3624_c0_g4_i1.p1 TRINITY_DN3624_c0_g4~~TRINITY_DN3624_c0_g4_i1.p1  ORF type:complete len:978 (-),score=172.85 TRINITY_DN3624_c0_g4_i1:9-2942(-)